MCLLFVDNAYIIDIFLPSVELVVRDIVVLSFGARVRFGKRCERDSIEAIVVPEWKPENGVRFVFGSVENPAKKTPKRSSRDSAIECSHRFGTSSTQPHRSHTDASGFAYLLAPNDSFSFSLDNESVRNRKHHRCMLCFSLLQIRFRYEYVTRTEQKFNAEREVTKTKKRGVLGSGVQWPSSRDESDVFDRSFNCIDSDCTKLHS